MLMPVRPQAHLTEKSARSHSISFVPVSFPVTSKERKKEKQNNVTDTRTTTKITLEFHNQY